MPSRGEPPSALGALQQELERHPYRTVALAAGVGYVLGTRLGGPLVRLFTGRVGVHLVSGLATLLRPSDVAPAIVSRSRRASDVSASATYVFPPQPGSFTVSQACGSIPMSFRFSVTQTHQPRCNCLSRAYWRACSSLGAKISTYFGAGGVMAQAR